MNTTTDALTKDVLAALVNSPMGAQILRSRCEAIESERLALLRQAAAKRDERVAYEAETRGEFERVTREFEEAKARLETAQRDFDRLIARRGDRITALHDEEADLRGQAQSIRNPLIEDMVAVLRQNIAAQTGRLGFSESFRLRTVDGIGPRRSEYAAIERSVDELEALQNRLRGIPVNSADDVLGAARELWAAHPSVFGPLPGWLSEELNSADTDGVSAAKAEPSQSEAGLSMQNGRKRGLLGRLGRTSA